MAGVDDFEVAEATYRAAIARWPMKKISLCEVPHTALAIDCGK